MNITLPQELADRLHERAEQLQVDVQQLVLTVLTWYLDCDEVLLDELAAWQKVHDEACNLFDKELESDAPTNA
jgi:hypothetical protein